MFEKNLKYYRLKKGMSMKTLADICELTPMAISNYESGKRKPDMGIISKLAKALDIHVVDFLAQRNGELVFVHKEFRRNTALTKTQQEYIREAVEDYFSRFFSSIECLGGETLPKAPPCYSIELGETYEESAERLRRAFDLQKEGPVDDIIGILENKGILLFELEIDNDHFSGMNGFVNGHPYIVMNKNMSAERKRTTVVHELAHLMFIWNEDDSVANEKEATQIAGAFLITRSDLFRELGVRKTAITKDMVMVCQEYGISMYLLVKRASQTGIISNSLEREFYIWANKKGWKKNEPSRIKIKEEPLLFRQLVFRAVNEGDISMQRGAELLRVPLADMSEYYGKLEA